MGLHCGLHGGIPSGHAAAAGRGFSGCNAAAVCCCYPCCISPGLHCGLPGCHAAATDSRLPGSIATGV